MLHIDKIEMVQRRDARFVKSRYRWSKSVSSTMLDEQGWPLSVRLKDAWLIPFYKIINNLAHVPHKDILVKVYECTQSKKQILI